MPLGQSKVLPFLEASKILEVRLEQYSLLAEESLLWSCCNAGWWWWCYQFCKAELVLGSVLQEWKLLQHPIKQPRVRSSPPQLGTRRN